LNATAAAAAAAVLTSRANSCCCCRDAICRWVCVIHYFRQHTFGRPYCNQCYHSCNLTAAGWSHCTAVCSTMLGCSTSWGWHDLSQVAQRSNNRHCCTRHGPSPQERICPVHTVLQVSW
jgi:hypothetical protein